MDKRNHVNPNVYGNVSDPVQGSLPTQSQNARGEYQYTFSPTWIAELRYAFNYLFFAQCPGSEGYSVTQFDLSPTVQEQLQAPQFPRLTFSDLTGGTTGMGWTTQYISGTQVSHVFTASLSHVTGNQAVKFGAQVSGII